MKLSTLMTITAVVSAVFGIAFALVPAQVSSLYGIEGSAALNHIGRVFGAALISIAVLSWSARNAAQSDARKAIVLALFVGNAVGFVVALIGQLANAVSMLGWSNVAIYLILALGFGYFQFSKPAAE